MGDPAKADRSKIEVLPWLDSPEWTATPGYLHLKSNYLLLIDNLLDLTHVAYVHKKTIAGDPREATTPTKTERVENGVRNGRWMIDFMPPPLFAKVGNFTSNVDRWQHVTWKAPATVYLDVGCAKTGTGAPQGDRSQGISIWSTHLATPETETSTHYFFCFARNFKLGDEPDVEAAVRGLEGDIHGRSGGAGGAAAERVRAARSTDCSISRTMRRNCRCGA